MRDAAPRYELSGADAFRLGQPVRLIGYPGDHTRFEAPPLASGRRLRAANEAEVGVGLADALGLRPGSTLAVQAGSRRGHPPAGGRRRAGAREPGARGVRARRAAAGRGPGARADARDPPRARAPTGRGSAPALAALGATPARVRGATTSNAEFLGILAAVLRGVGLAIGLVCLYALIQALAITARERRGAVALLRAAGADRATIALVLAGAALAVARAGRAGRGGARARSARAAGQRARRRVRLARARADARARSLLVLAGLLALAARGDRDRRAPRDARADRRGAAGGVMRAALTAALAAAVLAAGCGSGGGRTDRRPARR